jgi:hypothetical protein
MSRQFDEPIRCVIQIGGHIETDWSDWFLGLKIVPAQDGTTLLSGTLTDQAALQGVLVRIHNLGLPLIAVEVRDVESTAN